MSYAEQLVKLQRSVDLFSEYFNFYLCLVSPEGNEITLPSGLPLDCYNNELHQDSTCKSFTKELFQAFQASKKPITRRCPYGLYVNVSLTNISLGNSPIFLVCGKTNDPNNLENHLKILHTFFALPINFSKKKNSPVLNNKSCFGLTQQENNILKLIIAGLANKEIAAKLCISQSTVKAHIANIFKKLDVNNRTEAAIIFQSKESE